MTAPIRRSNIPSPATRATWDVDRREFFEKHEGFAQAIGIWNLAKEVPFSRDRIEHALAGGDHHLNTLNLALWDAKHVVVQGMAREAGLKDWSLSASVCTLKHVARYHVAGMVSLAEDDPLVASDGALNADVIGDADDIESERERIREGLDALFSDDTTKVIDIEDLVRLLDEGAEASGAASEERERIRKEFDILFSSDSRRQVTTLELEFIVRDLRSELSDDLDTDELAGAVVEFLLKEDMDPDQLKVSMHSRFSAAEVSVRGGHKSWLVFADEDDAENAAKERVEEDLDSCPEAFAEWFIQGHIDTEKLRDALRSDEENSVREDPEGCGYQPKFKGHWSISQAGSGSFPTRTSAERGTLAEAQRILSGLENFDPDVALAEKALVIKVRESGDGAFYGMWTYSVALDDLLEDEADAEDAGRDAAREVLGRLVGQGCLQHPLADGSDKPMSDDAILDEVFDIEAVEVDSDDDPDFNSWVGEEVDRRLSDPIAFVKERFGESEGLKKAVEWGGIDKAGASEDAIRADGWFHFVATYDNNYYSLDSGGVYCRTN